MFPELEPRLVWGALLARNLSMESACLLLLEWTQDSDDADDDDANTDDDGVLNYDQRYVIYILFLCVSVDTLHTHIYILLLEQIVN
jgi:hypothetical protein